MSVKNSNDIIGNRTRNLPACSAVPQPTAPPRTPYTSCKEERSHFYRLNQCLPGGGGFVGFKNAWGSTSNSPCAFMYCTDITLLFVCGIIYFPFFVTIATPIESFVCVCVCVSERERLGYLRGD